MFRFQNRTTLSIRLAALIITILWSGFWIFLVFAVMITEPFSARGMLFTLLFFLIFATTIFFSWKYPRRGGYAAIGVGVLLMIGFPILIGSNITMTMSVYIIFFMGLPPIVSGFLNILFCKRLLKEGHATSLDSMRISS